MRYNFLGQTGIKVSALCFGTMSFGAQADEAECAAMMSRCLDAGVNHFDCANMYGGGESERILGRLIQGRREALIVSSKVFFPVSQDVNARGLSRRHLRQACEDSLRRLKTDYLDLYYLHRFDERTSLEETLRGVEDLVREGKVLYPALSNFSAWQSAKALGIAARHGYSPAVCIQPMYSLLKRQAEVELLPMAQSEGLGVFPYSPLGAGMLTGKYTQAAPAAQGRLVESAQYQARYGDPSHPEIARRFVELAREVGVAPTTLAIAWVASHPAVTAPIIGARRASQLDEALAAADLVLDEALRERISALTPPVPQATDRSEEGGPHHHGPR